MIKIRRSFFIVGTMIVAMVLVAQAHEGATGIVKQRMDAMADMGKRVKAITQRLRAGRDLAAIKDDAAEMHRLAVEIAPLFPLGSLGPHSDARKAIWENWPDFTAKADALAAEAAKLAEISTDNVAALRKQIRAVGEACGACHETYRLKK